MSVPTYGTILMTPDMKHCLLVQSFFAKNSWSFPKGKVNENEDPVKCAIREVYEETGFDCTHLVNDKDFVEGQTSNYQYTRLYLVKNVPMDTKFCPRTRNEIKDCAWFVVDQLPTNRNDDGYLKDNRKIRANSFYMIHPFISKLKHWIMNERLRAAMGHHKKKQQQQPQQQNGQQRNGNKKNQVYTKQSGSPFFHNNVEYPPRNERQRHKSTNDVMETFNSPANGTFYNDHLKLQNNSSTPITNNSPFMTSSSSAFRATNSENKLTNNFKNGKKVNNKNGKVNQPAGLNVSQDQFKRRLFNENIENAQPLVNIKPFSFDIPDSWKNFKFDRQKISNCSYKP